MLIGIYEDQLEWIHVSNQRVSKTQLGLEIRQREVMTAGFPRGANHWDCR